MKLVVFSKSSIGLAVFLALGGVLTFYQMAPPEAMSVEKYRLLWFSYIGFFTLYAICGCVWLVRKANARKQPRG